MTKLSDTQLLINSDIVKNETATKANTATRIGTLFHDIVDSKINNIIFTGYTATTKTSINSKVNTTLFNTYTGNTILDRINTTTGSSVTLDFNSKTQRMFKTGSVSNYVTTTSMSISLLNNTNALVFNWIIFVNANLAITMPSSFQMVSAESRWNSGTKVLTLNYVNKKIEIGGVFDGTNWAVKVTEDYV